MTQPTTQAIQQARDEMIRALKPCPFCNARGEDLMIFCDPNEGSDNSGASRRIQCARCNIEAPFYPSEREAILAWNRRAHLPAGSEAVKPYAHEFGRSNGDGTYSVVIEKGEPRNPSADWPIKPLFAAPPSTPPAVNVQEEEPFGYWIEQRLAEPMLLRKPAYIPEPSELRTVTPLYLRSKQAPTVAVPDEAGTGEHDPSFPTALRDDEVRRWINACNHPPAREALRQLLAYRVRGVSEPLRARAEQREATPYRVIKQPVNGDFVIIESATGRIVTATSDPTIEQRETPSVVVGECATDGCGNPATVRFERDGIGSSYCADCYLKVQAIPFNRAAAPTSDGR